MQWQSSLFIADVVKTRLQLQPHQSSSSSSGARRGLVGQQAQLAMAASKDRLRAVGDQLFSAVDFISQSCLWQAAAGIG